MEMHVPYPETTVSERCRQLHEGLRAHDWATLEYMEPESRHRVLEANIALKPGMHVYDPKFLYLHLGLDDDALYEAGNDYQLHEVTARSGLEHPSLTFVFKGRPDEMTEQVLHKIIGLYPPKAKIRRLQRIFNVASGR